jgi:hypothetical protein
LLEEHEDLATSAFIYDIHSAAHDPFLSTSVDLAAALRALKEAVGRPLEPC